MEKCSVCLDFLKSLRLSNFHKFSFFLNKEDKIKKTNVINAIQTPSQKAKGG